jgi:hypothetical protein
MFGIIYFLISPTTGLQVDQIYSTNRCKTMQVSECWGLWVGENILERVTYDSEQI